MKYVPVLRYRQEERKAFLKVTMDPRKILPMIELVTAKVRTNSKQTIQETLLDDLDAKHIEKVIVDIPAYIPMTRQTKRPVSQYLTPLIANPMGRLSEYAAFPAHRIIPTVSYNPAARILSPGTLTSLHQALKSANFEQIAFRLFVPHFSSSMAEIQNLISPADIVVLDLDDQDHADPALTSIYNDVALLKQRTGCQIVLLRSAINTNITNVGLASGQPVIGAVNTLLQRYHTYGFDAFGDFAGTKKDDLKDGGTVSPGLIYYAWNQNVYYGFNSPVKSVAEFERVIVPDLQASIAWTQYTPTHHDTCFGCNTVSSVAQGVQSGKNQAMWKGVSISHYLYTMDEFL